MIQEHLTESQYWDYQYWQFKIWWPLWLVIFLGALGYLIFDKYTDPD